jgi:hypothetical protein
MRSWLLTMMMSLTGVAAADPAITLEPAVVAPAPIKVIARGTVPGLAQVEVRKADVEDGVELQVAVRDAGGRWWQSTVPDLVYASDNGMCHSTRYRVGKAAISAAGPGAVVARIEVKAERYMVCADRAGSPDVLVERWSEQHFLACRATAGGAACTLPIVTSTRGGCARATVRVGTLVAPCELYLLGEGGSALPLDAGTYPLVP